MFFRIIVRPYSLYLLQHIYLLRGFHSLIDTQLIHSIYQGDFVSTSRYSSTLNGRLPLLLRLQKRSGILSLIYCFILIFFCIYNYLVWFVCGLRGKAPSESHWGNKSIRKRILWLGLDANRSMEMDWMQCRAHEWVRIHVMNEHYSIDCVGMYGILCYPMVLGYNNPGRSTYDIASGMEGGGGQIGIGGLTLYLGKHEFPLTR